MNPRDRLLAKLRTPPVDIVLLDRRRIEREERVLESARLDGRENLPACDAAQPSDTERRIFERVTERVEAIGGSVAAALGDSVAAASLWTLPPAQRDVGSLVDTARIAVARRQAEERDALVAKHLLAQQRLRDLRLFRRKHGLDREARYPGPQARWVLWTAFALLFIGEAVLNSTAWSPVSELGLVGGLLRAGALALINLLLAAGLGGVVIPRLAHAHLPIRAGAWLAFAALTGVAIGYNAVVAVWRTAAEMHGSTVGFDVTLRTVLVDPVAAVIGSMDSLYLLIAGLVFFAVAAADIWALDDPYAGYGLADRLHKAARGAFDAHKARLWRETGRLVDGYAAEAARRATAAQAAFAVATSGMAAAADLRQQALDAAARQEKILHAVLRAYREENERVRSVPAPAYFARYPVLVAPVLDHFLGALSGHYARFESAVVALVTEVVTVRQELLGLAKSMPEEFFAFVESVEAASRRRLEDEGPSSTKHLPATFSGPAGGRPETGRQ